MYVICAIIKFILNNIILVMGDIWMYNGMVSPNYIEQIVSTQIMNYIHVHVMTRYAQYWLRAIV